MQILVSLPQAWGKLDRACPDRRLAPRLTLVAHCLDVAAVTCTLLALPTWRKRLDRLAGQSLTSVDLDRLVVLSFLHDTGKAGAGFYAKALPEEWQSAWRRHNRCGPDQQGHTKVVAPSAGLRS